MTENEASGLEATQKVGRQNFGLEFPVKTPSKKRSDAAFLGHELPSPRSPDLTSATGLRQHKYADHHVKGRSASWLDCMNSLPYATGM